MHSNKKYILGFFLNFLLFQAFSQASDVSNKLVNYCTGKSFYNRAVNYCAGKVTSKIGINEWKNCIEKKCDKIRSALESNIADDYTTQASDFVDLDSPTKKISPPKVRGISEGDVENNSDGSNGKPKEVQNKPTRQDNDISKCEQLEENGNAYFVKGGCKRTRGTLTVIQAASQGLDAFGAVMTQQSAQSGGPIQNQADALESSAKGYKSAGTNSMVSGVMKLGAGAYTKFALEKQHNQRAEEADQKRKDAIEYLQRQAKDLNAAIDSCISKILNKSCGITQIPNTELEDANVLAKQIEEKKRKYNKISETISTIESSKITEAARVADDYSGNVQKAHESTAADAGQVANYMLMDGGANIVKGMMYNKTAKELEASAAMMRNPPLQLPTFATDEPPATPTPTEGILPPEATPSPVFYGGNDPVFNPADENKITGEEKKSTTPFDDGGVGDINLGDGTDVVDEGLDFPVPAGFVNNGGGAAPPSGAGGGAGTSSTSTGDGQEGSQEPGQPTYAGLNSKAGKYSGSGGRGRKRGGGMGADLSKLLAQFMPKKEDVSKNGIQEFEMRKPASTGVGSILGPDVDLFQRIHDQYQNQQNKGSVL